MATNSLMATINALLEGLIYIRDFKCSARYDKDMMADAINLIKYAYDGNMEVTDALAYAKKIKEESNS